MITIKKPHEIEALGEGGARLAYILGELAKVVKEGAGRSAKEIDELAEKLAVDGGDKPAFLGYKPEGAREPYPASVCISINDEVVHGIPTADKIFKTGDVVAIDMGLIHKELITDSAVTVIVGGSKDGGEVKERKGDALDRAANVAAKKLVSATKKALDLGIKAARAGATVGDIGFAIEQFVRPLGFGLAEGLAGHGVGYEIHEDPYVPNTGKAGEGPVLKPGMVIAIEPMLTEGSGRVIFEKDGYTVRTRDGKRSAHFEHTIVITEKGPKVLTQKQTR